MGKLSKRVNASNAEFKEILDMPLRQKIEYIRLQGIAEDLEIEREKPKQSPIIDPFGITPEQQEFAYERYHALHLKRIEGKLTSAEAETRNLLKAILAVTLREHWASRGDFDPHWSNVSTNAIAHLRSLGFQNNDDIQQYLDTGKLPQSAPASSKMGW